MKQNSIYVLLILSVIGGLSFTKMSGEVEIGRFALEKSHLNSGGAPTGRSGAPGEGTCTACHSGSVQSGSGFNGLTLVDQGTQQVVSEYTPGTTYTVTVTMSSQVAKRGFQVSPRIVSNNSQAGTATGVSTVSTVSSSGGRQYITHTNTSNTSQVGWAFNWTAPDTNVGDVCFYVATNETNSNNSTSGDVIRTSQHTFSAVNNAGLNDQQEENTFSAVYRENKHSIALNFRAETGGDYSVNLVDFSGKSVFFKRFADLKNGQNETEIYLPQLKAGIYLVHFFENNRASSQKIYISR